MQQPCEIVVGIAFGSTYDVIAYMGLLGVCVCGTCSSDAAARAAALGLQVSSMATKRLSAEARSCVLEGEHVPECLRFCLALLLLFLVALQSSIRFEESLSLWTSSLFITLRTF